MRKDFNLFRLVPYVLLFMVFVGTAFSQLIWQRTYGGAGGEWGYSVQQTTDEGYIVAGWTNSFGNGWQAYLIKTDSFGDTLWTRTYGGTGDDYAYSVQQTTDEGYIIAGYTNSFGNDEQVYLIKIDSLGDTLWTKNYGGASGDYGYSVQQTTDGGYIIAGRTYSFGNFEQVYLIKTNPVGDTLWTKTFGGTGMQRGWSVKQTTDGGYIITGDDFSIENGKVYLIKTDSLADTLWTRHYGESLLGDGGASVQQTIDGGYIITGVALTMPHNHHVLLIKTDSLGNNPWSRTYGDESGGDYSYGRSVRQTTGGNYIIAGKTDGGDPYYQVYLIKTDTLGNLLWFQTYGGGNSEDGYCVQQTQDGGYIIAGVTNSFGDGYQVYVIKTDEYGNTGIKDNSHTGCLPYAPFPLISPNPFSSFTTVIGHEKERFILYDTSGRRVDSYFGDRIGFGLSAGVYFILPIDQSLKPIRVVKVR